MRYLISLFALGLGIVFITATSGEAQAPKKGDQRAPGMDFQFRIADTNNDGKISRDEFMAFTARNPVLKENTKAASVLFDRLDANRDGGLSADEFRMMRELPKQKDKENEANGIASRPPPDGSSTGGKSYPGMPNYTKGSTTTTGFVDYPTPEQVTFFEKKIRPALSEYCYSCHTSTSPDKLKGGLALDTKDRKSTRLNSSHRT